MPRAADYQNWRVKSQTAIPGADQWSYSSGMVTTASHSITPPDRARIQRLFFCFHGAGSSGTLDIFGGDTITVMKQIGSVEIVPQGNLRGDGVQQITMHQDIGWLIEWIESTT